MLLEKLVGNTPLVKLKNYPVFAKLEMFNPSGSIKDRIVKEILEEAEAQRSLEKGDTIIEATSGNTGISLAMFSAIKDYKAKIVMPESATEERKRVLRLLGAKLIFVRDEYEAVRVAKKLAKRKDYFYLGQFENPLNVVAHYKTGEEIIKQMKGKVDVFIAGIGTGGTITGVAEKLKEFNPRVKIVGVEPILHREIDGLVNFSDSGVKLKLLRLDLVDEIIKVRREDAIHMAREIAKKEGLLVGISSGATLYVALKKIKEFKNKNIVVMFADTGLRYLSVLGWPNG